MKAIKMDMNVNEYQDIEGVKTREDEDDHHRCPTPKKNYHKLH